MSGSGLGRSATDCLERTRKAVLNVMVAVGAGIAVSGFMLGRRAGGALPRAQRADLEQWSHVALFGLIAVSYLARRFWAGRSALRDASSRASRFYRGHVAGAILGALNLPLGYGLAWATDPSLKSVAPFWVAALALGALSLPRAVELDGFDDDSIDPDPGVGQDGSSS